MPRIFTSADIPFPVAHRRPLPTVTIDTRTSIQSYYFVTCQQYTLCSGVLSTFLFVYFLEKRMFNPKKQKSEGVKWRVCLKKLMNMK